MSTNVVLTIDGWVDWNLVFNLKEDNKILPLNLTGYTCSAQIRETHSSTVILATPTVTFKSPRTSGVLTLSLTATQTGALNFYDAYYDIILTSNLGVITKLQEGRIKLNKSVTR